MVSSSSTISMGVKRIETTEEFKKFAEFKRDINFVSFQSFETQIKIKCLVQKFASEENLSPYKLSLMSGLSTSQTHAALRSDWSPSLKIARRLANSIPHDYAIQFDIAWSRNMPRYAAIRENDHVWGDKIPKISKKYIDSEQKIFKFVDEIGGYVNVHRIENHVISLLEAFVSDKFPKNLTTPVIPRIFYSFILSFEQEDIKKRIVFQSPFVLSSNDKAFVMRWFQYNVVVGVNLYSIFVPIDVSDLDEDFVSIAVDFYKELNSFTASSFSGNHPYFNR